MSAREVMIGLDVGTTAAKASAYVAGHGRVGVASRGYPLSSPEPGWEVQDPDRMVAGVLDALAEVVGTLRGQTVAGISCSTAMHGLLGLDAEGRPLTPLLTWADARAAEEALRLAESGQARDLHHRSGTPVHPMSPLTKLLWFARHEPELCRRVRTWVGLKDYLLLRLTGTLVTELSSASGTGLLDLATRDWSPSTLDLAGIDADRLPPVRPTTDQLPLAAEVAQQVGLAPGLPVVLGAGDGPLGNLGTGALAPGVAGLSMGTSAAVRLVVPEPAVDDRLFCYALTGDRWVVGGPLSNGGIVLEWALDLVGADLVEAAQGGAYTRLLELAEAVPAGSDGLVVIPYLLAERAPLWDPDLTGTVLGLQRRHGRGHLVRACLEGVAMQVAGVVDALDSVTPVVEVRATGGAFRDPLWGRIVASVLDRPTRLMASTDGSGLGAAALGLYALGHEDSLEDAVTALSPGVLDGGPAVTTTPADVACYRSVRASVPELIHAQQRLAAAFPRG